MKFTKKFMVLFHRMKWFGTDECVQDKGESFDTASARHLC